MAKGEAQFARVLLNQDKIVAGMQILKVWSASAAQSFDTLTSHSHPTLLCGTGHGTACSQQRVGLQGVGATQHDETWNHQSRGLFDEADGHPAPGTVAVGHRIVRISLCVCMCLGAGGV